MPRRAKRLDGSRRRRPSQSCRTAAARRLAIACSAARMTALGLRGSEGCCRVALVMMPTSAGRAMARRDGECMGPNYGRASGWTLLPSYQPSAIGHQLKGRRSIPDSLFPIPYDQVQVPEFVPEITVFEGRLVGETDVTPSGEGFEQGQVGRARFCLLYTSPSPRDRQ